jgi:hypothetical protein
MCPGPEDCALTTINRSEALDRSISQQRYTMALHSVA